MAITPHWRTTYLNARGEQVQARLYAPNLKAVREEVAQRGGELLHTQLHTPKLWEREVLTTEFKEAFLRSVQSFTEGGHSAGRALMLAVELHNDHARVRAELRAAIEVLERGGSFSEGLAALGFFDPPVIGMLSAGELAGKLNEAIEDAIQYVATRNRGSLAWKAFAMSFFWESTTALGALQMMANQAIPWLRANTPRSSDVAALAAYTSSIDSAALFVDIFFWLTLALLLGATGLLVAYRYGSLATAKAAEQLLFKVPGMRDMLLENALGFAYSLLGRLMRSNVRTSEALSLVVRHTPLPALAEFWQEVGAKRELGLSMAEAFSHRLIGPQDRTLVGAPLSQQALAKTFVSMGRMHTEKAERARAWAVKFYLHVMLGYFGIVVVLGAWLLKLQGGGLDLLSVNDMGAF